MLLCYISLELFFFLFDTPAPTVIYTLSLHDALPILDVMFGDFITLTMDQMVNQAAKAHYMSGGKIKVPIVFRTTLGATRDRKSTRLNSSHTVISYAVFCLKKKNNTFITH